MRILIHQFTHGMHEEMAHPESTWKNFEIEEQAEILKADRSNNWFDTKIPKTLNYILNLKYEGIC